jgi:LacI family transcriptional regulator
MKAIVLWGDGQERYDLNATTAKIKIEDVARMAGVSPATASRALRDQALVQIETRERIKKIANQLGYSPHAAARTLASRRSHMIGLFAIMLTDYPFTDILRGAMAGACERGYGLMLVESKEQASGDHLQEIIRAVREGRVDGCLGYVEELEARRLAELQVPCVAVESYGVPKVPTVHLDREAAGYDTTSHLLNLGHRRIAILVVDNPAGPFLIEGYRRAFEERGLEFRQELVMGFPSGAMLGVDVETPEGYARVVEAGIRQAMASAEPPTAIVFSFTQRAMAGLRTFRKMGIRIPEDMAVVGVADVPGSDLCEPPLTVWKGDYVAVGRRGVDVLIDQIEGKVGASVLVGGKLVVRESCGGRISD